MKKKYTIKTKYGEFIASIWLDKKDKVYFVTIPIFPGPMTEARSLNEAKRYATDLIELECLSAIEEGKIIVDNQRKVYGKSIHPGNFSFA